MVVAIVIIILLGCALGQSSAVENSSLQAQATVEIQYDGHSGSGIIQMIADPESTSSWIPDLSTTWTTSTTTITSSSSPRLTSAPSTTSISTTTFRTPPSFGITRSQLINSTSTTSLSFPTGTGSSQMIVGNTATPVFPNSEVPSSNYGLVAGSGLQNYALSPILLLGLSAAEIGISMVLF